MKILRFQTRNELSAHFKEVGRSDKNTYYLVEGVGILYTGSPGGDGFISLRNGFSVVFPGDRLFQLRATHGLPLGDALAQIQMPALAVDWVGFIKEARLNGWWDFQTLEAVEQALVDADWNRTEAPGIILRLKCWIMENPL